MKTILQGWNQPYQEIQSEEASLSFLDLHNKTRYSRRKNQAGLLELASREAHEQKMTYFATMLNEDDSPYCAIESNEGYFGVDFLRDDLDNYLFYVYRDEHFPGERLFLKSIGLITKSPQEFDTVSSFRYLFNLDGSWNIITHKGTVGAWATILEESPPFSEEELSLLWVDYPEFGKYEELIRLDRIPLAVREEIFKVTDKEYPAFREHLQRDIERYQSR